MYLDEQLNIYFQGWHNRINNKANGCQMDIYKLIPLLHEESQFIGIQISLIDDKKLNRYKRKHIKKNEKTIDDLWKRYDNNEITDMKFLKQISYIYISY